METLIVHTLLPWSLLIPFFQHLHFSAQCVEPCYANVVDHWHSLFFDMGNQYLVEKMICLDIVAYITKIFI